MTPDDLIERVDPSLSAPASSPSPSPSPDSGAPDAGAGLRYATDRLVAIALRGLAQMYLPDSHEFVQTVRGVRGPTGPHLSREGANLRYAAMCALGLHYADEAAQRVVLQGETAASLTGFLCTQALTHDDPGAVALTAWAAAEVSGRLDGALFERLQSWLDDPSPLMTVDVSWMLSAADAARMLGDTSAVSRAATRRLLDAQGPQGIFPHVLPAASQGRFRAHVGSFADQVYPIQALSRLAAATGSMPDSMPDSMTDLVPALSAANACAARVCELQGEDGQWWWHYDVRDGSVVEGFPVYSVHQHAMGPMVLFDLVGNGGDDHRDAILRGLRWLDTHPEVFGDLVDETYGVIWRKVGRREPPKAVRKLNAVTTSLRPGLHLPALDRAFPAVTIDRECRPYELGWLLYAWLRPSASTLDGR